MLKVFILLFIECFLPEDEQESVNVTCPRQYLISSEVHKYQLRAHIYQARDLVSGDKTGLSGILKIIFS